MSDNELIVDNKTVSGNDLSEDTNVNKDIKEDKRTTKKEDKEKQSANEDNNSNSTNETKIDNNMIFGNELNQKKKETFRILCSNVRGLD